MSFIIIQIFEKLLCMLTSCDVVIHNSFFEVLLNTYHMVKMEEHCHKEGCGTEKSDTPVIFQQGNEKNEFHDFAADEIPRILWWHDHIYPHSKDQKEVNCPLGTCLISKDRETIKDHLTRGIIFYGTSFENNDLPLPRLPYHEWALFHEESPKNNWMFSTELGISIFNYTATFRRESDYPLSTQFMRDTDKWFSNEFFVETSEKNRFQKELGLAPLVFVQRDCNPPSGRDQFVKELMKYIKVDSYGPCVNNKEMPKEINGFNLLSSKKYYHFLARYKFQIAIENALCQDYMTEKVFRPLDIGSVPVYLGSDKITDFMPSEKSVIVISDFNSPKELADLLLELNNDDDKYNEYLTYRKNGITNPAFQKSIDRQPWKVSKWQKMNFGHFMFAGFSCFLCDRVHERNNRLKIHIKDRSKPPLPNRIAKLDHMNCSFGKTFYTEKMDYPSTIYSLMYEEPKALIKMFHANETNSNNWEKYKSNS